MTMQTDRFWTQGRTERLIALVRGNHSAADIAAIFEGRVTRNAVLGKIHRLRKAGAIIPPREEESVPAPLPPRRPAPKAAKRPPDPIVRAPAPEPAPPPRSRPLTPRDVSRAVRIAQLRDLHGSCRHCRFILGAVAGPEGTLYCGRRTIAAGKPYCEEHTALCTPADAQPARRRAA